MLIVDFWYEVKAFLFSFPDEARHLVEVLVRAWIEAGPDDFDRSQQPPLAVRQGAKCSVELRPRIAVVGQPLKGPPLLPRPPPLSPLLDFLPNMPPPSPFIICIIIIMGIICAIGF